MDDTDRRAFLRRTGALGLAGAAALGYPLLETRAAGSAPLLPPRDTIAAGGGATVKIGHIDGFSGVYASASQSQELGLEVALEQAMKKNSRIKYVIVKGDDANTPATGSTEARRLVVQEKVDILAGCLSSGVGLAVSNTCEELGSFFLAIGTHDTNITGQGAHHVTFRQTCSNAMLANAVGPALLKFGKKWYFITADYAFGNDAQARLQKILLAQGGQVVANDKHALGAIDFSSYMTKARNTDANVMVFCNSGPDTQNAVKAAIQLGINQKMKFGGILCGNDVAVGLPVDDIVGSTWGYVWGPDAGGARSPQIYKDLKTKAKNVDWRMYLGLMAGETMINRLNAIGTTDQGKIVASYLGYKYDAGKKSDAYFRACDHQSVQETYAGTIVPKAKRKSDGEYFAITNRVGGDYAAESCSEPDSAAATKIFTTETPIPARQGYTPLSLK
ncbi:MAG TPA: ABC transporter substrate-binding protein [Candidatus Cybelea sp.]